MTSSSTRSVRHVLQLTVPLLLVLTAVTGCGSDDTTAPTVGGSQPVFQIVSGNDQIGVVSDTLDSELVVGLSRLSNDGARKPVPGATVRFTTQAGNGTPTDDNVETNGIGEAATRWALGSDVASQELRATALLPDSSDSLSVTFNATAGPETMTLSFVNSPNGLIESYVLLREFVFGRDGFNQPIHPDLVAVLVSFDAPGPLFSVSGDTLTAAGEDKETVTASYRSTMVQRDATFIHDLSAFDWTVTFSGYSGSGLDSLQAALSVDAVTYSTAFTSGGRGLLLELSGQITRYPVGGGSPTVSDTTGVLLTAVELPDLLAYVKPDTVGENISWSYSFAFGADYTVPGPGISYLIPAATDHDFGPVITPGMASYSSTSLVGTPSP
jgi:hypothetical protein